jgi:hypothetical protein
MRLIAFLADLSRDPDLYELFRREPRTAMKQRGLSRREQDLILDGDKDALAAAIKLEVTNNPGHVSAKTPWPGGGRPAFDAIRPGSGEQGQTANVTIRLSVNMGRAGPSASWAQAREAPQKIETYLVRGKTKIEGRVMNPHEPVGDHPYAEYNATFEIPKAAPLGKYQVSTLVYVSPDPDTYLSSGAPFEVLKAQAKVKAKAKAKNKKAKAIR